MNVFITGGTGFIGSNLINCLLKEKIKIFALYRDKNLINPSFNKKVHWIKKNLQDLNLDDLKSIETIFHLASVGVSPKQATDKEFENINVNASKKLINLAFAANVRRFIATGSCLEYGAEANNWKFIPPNAQLKPLCPYSKSKAKSFQVLSEFAENNEIELFYGRIFSAYGSGQYIKNFWASLEAAAISGNDFYMTPGEQIRDFIHINDVVNHLKVALFRKDISKKEPLIVNIGSGVGTSLKEFAAREWERLNAKGNLVIGKFQYRNNEIKRLVADISCLEYQI